MLREKTTGDVERVVPTVVDVPGAMLTVVKLIEPNSLVSALLKYSYHGLTPAKQDQLPEIPVSTLRGQLNALEFLKRCDARLYEAKRRGRNRIC